MTELKLDANAKLNLRKSIVLEAMKLLGTLYEEAPEGGDWTIGKWLDFSRPPKSLDCSGLVEGVFHFCGLKIMHGSKNQFASTIAIELGKEEPGDLAFFAHEKDITRVYHVGIVFDHKDMIESRKFDPKASFPTGKVILRPKINWENWISFVGYRRHPKLI